MRVSCPSCKTVYNVDDKKIPDTGANLKCAKCKSSFPVKKAAPSEAVPLPGIGAPASAGSAPAGDSRSAVPLPGGTGGGSGAVPLPGEGTAPRIAAPAVPLPGADDAFDFGAPSKPPEDPLESLGLGPPKPAEDPLDFGAPSAQASVAFAPPAEEASSAGGGLDFGDLGLSDSAVPPSKPGLDFGEPQEAPAPRQSLDFGEVSFGDTPERAGDSGGGLDFGDIAAAPAPQASPRAPAKRPAPKADDALEFDPLAQPKGRPGGDDLEADLSAPMPSSAPTGKADDLELLDFIDDAGAGAPEAGKRPRPGQARYQIRRKSGKVFGPFDQPAVVKMLAEGQLLGNEDVSSGGDTWTPIGSVPAFAEAIQKLMESPGAVPLARDPAADAGPTKESSERAMDRLKALYGDRMASIAVVDTASATKKLKQKLPFIALGVVALLALSVGVYLGTTPYGFFGLKKLFPKTLKAGSGSYAKFKEAAKLLDESLLAENDSVVESRALFAQAVFYLKRRYSAGDDKLERAKRFVDELLLSAPDHPEVIKARAGYHILKGDETLIRVALQAAAAVAKEDHEFSFLLAESYFRERQAEPAIAALNPILAVEPGSAKALHAVGVARTLQKDPDYAAAKVAFTKALEAAPRHLASAVESAAISVQRLGDLETAVELLKRPLSAEGKTLLAPPDLSRAHYLMGLLLAARHETAEAEKRFEEALAIDPGSAPAKAAYGRFLLKQRKDERAFELFEAATKADPTEIDYVDGLVRAMIGATKLHMATKALEDAGKSHPGNPRVAFLNARVADVANKQEAAERSYKRAIAGDPKAWEPSLFLGKLYLRQRKMDAAGESLGEALAKAPKLPDTHVGQGDFLLGTLRTDDAKSEYLAALSIDRENASAHFGLAQVLFAEGAFEDAKKEFVAALALDPVMPQLNTQYGTLLWQMKDHAGAAEALERAKNTDSKDSGAIWRLGAVYFELSKLEEAQKNLEAALSLDPANPDVYFYKGRMHFARHETTQAMEAMKSALERSSMRPDFHFHMGNIFLQANRFAEAVEEWGLAVKQNPRYADALEALGKGYQEQGDGDKATGFFEKAMAADPSRTRLVLNIADCLYNQNLYDRAITKYQEALKLNEANVGAYFKIGRSFNEKQKVEDAIKWYKLAAEKDPEAKEVQRWLGYAYKDKGRRKEAIEAFDRYLTENPKASDAADIANEIFDLQH
jgi:predicted Zn finger-like uncharacterized protein